ARGVPRRDRGRGSRSARPCLPRGRDALRPDRDASSGRPALGPQPHVRALPRLSRCRAGGRRRAGRGGRIVKRYLAALLGAVVVTIALTWVGARIARVTSGPENAVNDFTVGQRYVLCGHAIESRMALAGYDLDQWTGERCRNLSAL